jgi:RNase P subunit RPR2
MSLLNATCPKCRSVVNTGLSADQKTLQDLGPKLQVLVLCDECREYQKMFVRDLYLSAEAVDAAA